jgi:hypothetical protein
MDAHGCWPPALGKNIKMVGLCGGGGLPLMEDRKQREIESKEGARIR